MIDPLLPFLHPRGVAVVGVSTSPEKLGYGVARNLVQSGFAGAIHFVGQQAGELFGIPLRTGLSQVPDPVDLAVFVIPASAVPEGLRDCGARGIHAAIVVSAGFREAGPAGEALERQCLEIAKAGGIRVLGPNCIGTIDTHFPLDTSFLQPPMPPQGAIAFVSHSGAFCAAVVDWSRRQGFGFSQIISLGNQADINETDVLPLVAQDDHTRVLALYMEGVSDGVEFVRTATGVSRIKPVVALKVGRSEAGQRAAASHTAALAASDTAFDAAFAKAGVFRATSTEQMFDWARALESCPLPGGGSVAILTDAGGPGVIAADALESLGLKLAGLSEATRAQLAGRLPAAASVVNPVDMLASASPEDYADCLKTLLEDASVDAALVILPPPPMFKAEDVADAIIPLIRTSSKPVVIALLGSELTDRAFARFNQARVPTYPFPERAISALGILARRTRSLDAIGVELSRPASVPSAPLAGGTLSQLLDSYGIQFVPLVLARSPAEAAAAAEHQGFPVVLKVASPNIVHKSDFNGVVLNLGDSAQVASAYTQLVAQVRARLPNAAVEGAWVQRQIFGGQEVIVGVARDANFGPLVMFGSGGVETEGLGDVAFSLAPLHPSEADDLLRRTWAGRRLDGFRNLPPADRSAVRDALVGLSWLAHDHPELMEIEINPLRVLAQGAFALDVRVNPAPMLP